MNDLRYTLGSSAIEDAEEKTSDSNMLSEPQEALAVLENNPKVDVQLLTAYYRTKLRYERLRAAGLVSGAQGANYRLSHPLADPDMPTDAMHRSEPPKEEEREAREDPRYRLSHPLADPDMPTDAMHRSEPPKEDTDKPQAPAWRGYSR